MKVKMEELGQNICDKVTLSYTVLQVCNKLLSVIQSLFFV